MISNLPSDIIHDIGRWLPQHDLLHLALTCERIYHIVHGHLYSSIIIDSSKCVYREHESTKLYSSLVKKVDGALEPVVIRTLYALTQFLKTLSTHPQYARLIRVFVFRPNIPDIRECDLNNMLKQIFPNLLNVRVLDWYSMDSSLYAETISLLPKAEQLHSLCGNFYAFNSVEGLFSSLTHLNISYICHQNSRAIDFAAFPAIKSLTLSKSLSESTIQNSTLGICCQNRGHKNNGSQMSISQLCKFSPSVRLQLRSLVLRDLCLTSEDAKHILTGIDLHHLKKLSLDNCFENLFDGDLITENSVRIVRRTSPASTFLDILLEGVSDIRSLNLGITNDLLCNAASLRAIKNLKALAKLNVHIKTLCSRNLVNLAPLINAVQKHKETLRYLSICIKSVNADRSPACSKSRKYYDLVSISGIEKLTHLKVICLPITYSQSFQLPQVLDRLQNLKLAQLEITDPTSLASSSLCASCDYLPTTNFCIANSLVSQDYFDQFSLATGGSQSNKDRQYFELAELYRSSFHDLSFVRFEANSSCEFYSIDSSSSTCSKQELSVDEYNVLVDQIVHIEG